MKKTLTLLMLTMFLFSIVPLSYAEEDADTAVEVEETEVDEVKKKPLRPVLKALDKKEDKLDKREDFLDKREDKFDALNLDRKACMQRCEEAGNEDCEKKCARLDKKEDFRDAREDVRDTKEDFREFKRDEFRKLSPEEREQAKADFEAKKAEMLENLEANHPELYAKLKEHQGMIQERIADLSDEEKARLAALDKDQLERFAKLSVAKRAELAGMSEEEIKAKIADIRIKKVRNADDLKARDISPDRMKDARDKFKQANDRYKAARTEYNEARDAFRAAQESGDEEAALQAAKDVLSKSAQSIIGHLEKIKSKVEENENIEADEASDLIERIDNQIAEVEEIAANVESAETPEEVRAAAKELNGKWKNIKQKARGFAQNVVEGKIRDVIHKGQVLEKRLENAVAKLEEEGVDVSDIEAKLSEFSALVASATDKATDAKDKLKEARESEDEDTTQTLVDEAKELMQSARADIESGKELVREIVSMIKEAKGDFSVDQEEEVEVEQEE